jgi:hypothetical protein
MTLNKGKKGMNTEEEDMKYGRKAIETKERFLKIMKETGRKGKEINGKQYRRKGLEKEHKERKEIKNQAK